MAKISLAGFKDPVRRPRYIIWTGVIILSLAAFVIVALGATSTRWFCIEACHKVQDDSILAYEASSHANVSCIACHMPADANPIVFVLHKAEALGELYLTVTNKYELPLNGQSHVALSMGSLQCTQCHTISTRKVTPSAGIRMDHDAHLGFNMSCPTCHNRIAHIENFELTLKDPQSGEPNRPHEDFTKMKGCFRCHGLESAAAATGRCATCHTAGFEFKPDDHRESGFHPNGHGKIAKEAEKGVDAALASGHGKEAKANPLGVQNAYASGGGGGEPVPFDQVSKLIEEQRGHESDPHASFGTQLPSVDTVFYCATCHRKTFCENCHKILPVKAEYFR
ncbi:MAG: NapC/NirT family cytochrome c [Coriobacteriia bacterium]|nr:NapC/NirT family cytochrome c [Coriobacteriia bacterium]